MNYSLFQDLHQLQEGPSTTQTKQLRQEIESFLADIATLQIRGTQYTKQLQTKLQQLFKWYRLFNNKCEMIFTKLKNMVGQQLANIIPQPALFGKTIIQIIKNKQHKSQIQYPAGLTTVQIMSVRICIQKLINLQHTTLQQAQKLIKFCSYKQALQNFVIQISNSYTPNVVQICGKYIAGKLLCQTGGIKKLSLIPAGNIQLIGRYKTNQVIQLSHKLGLRNNGGLFIHHQQVIKAIPQNKMKVIRMLSTNVAKMAKVDIARTSPQGYTGKMCYGSIMARYKNIQQQQAPQFKPLPPIIQQPKKRRGGKRFRKMVQRNAQSQLRKLQNRISFGQKQDQIEPGIGLGMIGKKIGKIKVQTKEQKLIPSKRLMERLKRQKARSGLISNLQMTGQKQIILVNNKHQQQQKYKNDLFD